MKGEKIYIGWVLFIVITILNINYLYSHPILIKAYLHENSVAKSLDTLLVVNSIIVVFYGLIRMVEPKQLQDIMLQLQVAKFEKLYGLYKEYEYKYTEYKKRRAVIELLKIISGITFCMLITNIVAYMCSLYVLEWFVILTFVLLVEGIVIVAKLIDSLYEIPENQYPEPTTLLKYTKINFSDDKVYEYISLKLLANGLHIKIVDDLFNNKKAEKQEIHMRMEMVLPFVFDDARLEIIDEIGKTFFIDLAESKINKIDNKWVIDILIKEKVIFNKDTYIFLNLITEEYNCAVIYFEEYGGNQYKSIDFSVTEDLKNKKWNRENSTIGYRIDNQT